MFQSTHTRGVRLSNLKKRRKKMKNLTTTAGNNNTDLGSIVGTASSRSAAARIGRKAISTSLPDGCGIYKVHDEDGRELLVGERSGRTKYKWDERESSQGLTK